MDVDKLIVAEIYANQGPVMKRFRAGSHGRANSILKRSSHVGVAVSERES
jgi:large subunit ribosomal protein L22